MDINGQSEGNAKFPIFMFVGKYANSYWDIVKEEFKKYPESFTRKNSIITDLRKDWSTLPVAEIQRWISKEIELLRPKIIVTFGSDVGAIMHPHYSHKNHKWKFSEKYQSWFFSTVCPKFRYNQFRNDIRIVSKMWRTLIGDYRLTINKEEWRRQLAMNKIISLGIVDK